MRNCPADKVREGEQRGAPGKRAVPGGDFLSVRDLLQRSVLQRSLLQRSAAYKVMHPCYSSQLCSELIVHSKGVRRKEWQILAVNK